jgi:hypothetical protein
MNEQQVIAAVKAQGFDAGLAVATDAEIKAGSACGQLSVVNEEDWGVSSKETI